MEEVGQEQACHSLSREQGGRRHKRGKQERQAKFKLFLFSDKSQHVQMIIDCSILFTNSHHSKLQMSKSH